MDKDLFGLDTTECKSTKSSTRRIRQVNSKTDEQLAFPFETLLPTTANTSSRYPTLFTRIPLFEPIKDRTKADTKNWGLNGGDNYSAGALRIQRFGPGLSIYDEDTLIAILQLGAQKSLKGPRSLINSYLNSEEGASEGDPNKVEEVYIGCVTPYRINDYLGRGTGGDQLRQCQDSIDRLSLTQLRFFNDAMSQLGTTKFFDVIRDYSTEGNVHLKINAQMVTLLKEYTKFDLSIRRILTDTGKSVHRFLSGQEGDFNIPLTELMKEIRYHGVLKDFKRSLLGRNATTKTKGEIGQLKILEDCQWLEYFEISGTGRKTPFVLHVRRNVMLTKPALAN